MDWDMTDLSKIGVRQRLKPRVGDEPHWQRLRAGSYIGFRPSKREGRGMWFARAYDVEALKYRRKALGDYGAFFGNDVFTQARKDAEKWADSVESGGVRDEKLLTVADACRAYVNGKPRPAPKGKRQAKTIAEGMFERHVYKDPIARVRLEKLRRHHLREWRKRLESAPALVSRSKRGERRTRERAKSTVNRDMVPLRAALRAVLSPGAPGCDAAWQEALRPHRGSDRRRTLYLDRQERRSFLDAADESISPFLRAMCQMPLRPGATAALCVQDFDVRIRGLTIGKDKNGNPRQITLPQVVANFLSQQVKGKLPKAYLFTRPDGRPWDKDSWKGPIKDAAKRADLSAALTAYTLRHSVITDLIREGLPILTVAQLAGTSVAMIEKHYGHLVRSDAEAALAAIAL